MKIIRTILALSLLIVGQNSLAHHPHDMIDAMAISPSYTDDHTIYIANSDHLFKSENGGYGWKELANGLDHTHTISSIKISPSAETPQTIFIATLGNGIYRSKDGGTSWANTSSGLQDLKILDLSARPGGIVFAIGSTGRLFVSNDDGESWRTALTPASTRIISLSPPGQSRDNRILAGDDLGRILVSTDAGAHWAITAQLPEKVKVTVVMLDPSDESGATYYVGTQNSGLYKTSDNGTSFTSLDSGLPAGSHIVSLTLSPDFSRNHTLVATSWREAVFISKDAGDTWIKYDAGLTIDKQADTSKYRSPYFRQVQFATGDNQLMFLAAFTGLYRSTDNGRSWRELETLPVSLIKGLAVSPSDNGRHSIAISTYGGGAYVSHDRGQSWTIGNKGLKTTRLMEIEFSPAFHDDHTLFSGSVGLLLKSTDDGASWEQIRVRHNSLRKKIIYKLIAYGLPKNTGQQYLEKADKVPVYPTVFSPSPGYARDKTLLFGTRWHGIYRSEDNGHDAENIWMHTDGAVTGLWLSPNFMDDNMAFAYFRGDGIYKTTDSGDSWYKVTMSMTSKQSDHGDFAVVFSPVFSADQTLYAAGPTGLFISTDQGENWYEQGSNSLGLEPNILALAISPNYEHDHTILVSLKGSGLYKSVDRGQNFSTITGSLIRDNHSIERIEFSPDFSQDQTIYAASNRNLFLSVDGGNDWSIIKRPARYEDNRDVVRFGADWNKEEGTEYSASTVHYANTSGAMATLDFSGCGVNWIATKSPLGGKATVYLDGTVVESVDLNSSQTEPVSVVFSSTGLSCGPHTITVEVKRQEDDHTTGKRVTIDAFDILLSD